MIRKLLVALLVPAALLLLAEAALRLGGRPRGTFLGTEGHAEELWPPGYSAELRFGPIPYRVEANSLGFRGPELRSPDDPADVRIAAIGDSMTDGFFVDNEATYPSQLEQRLRRRGVDAEVVNVARGGGSIDLFITRLEKLALPLRPDLVIVSFVTNDLQELGAATSGGTAPTRLGSVFVIRSALGEALMEWQLKLRGASSEPEASLFEGLELSGGERYLIPGADRYAENSRRFLERFRKFDTLVLGERLPPELRRTLDDEYLPLLERFAALCAEQDVGLLYVYFPAYPQIYLANAPKTLRELLAQRARELSIPFLDLTDALRAASAEGPLHLAPLDYHLNPRGNRVVAEAIAEALTARGFLEAPRSAHR